ncbi:hypothetical protein UFOVP1155_9 [uncultured Caudovirales phage]|uniref:Uncharacterized protein n=1 Tax=uncultured Caudovirales phage TaxID=2100421 RepID=A0A6J5QRC4_9CAUD|nr:hypothetical protein UFOVP1155_9 [uncultured Caudovirales phage]
MNELETRLHSLRATRMVAIDALHLPQSPETMRRLRDNIEMLDGCIAELEARQSVEHKPDWAAA